MDATSPLSGQPPVISLDVLVAFEEAGGSFRDPDSAVALPGSLKGTGQTCYMVSSGRKRDRQRWGSSERCDGPQVRTRWPQPLTHHSSLGAARCLTTLSVQLNLKVFSGLNMTLLCHSWRLRDTFHLISDGAAQPLMLLREKYRAGLFQAEFSMSLVPSPHRGPTGAIAQTSPATCCHSPVNLWSTGFIGEGWPDLSFLGLVTNGPVLRRSGTGINVGNRGTPQRRTPPMREPSHCTLPAISPGTELAPISNPCRGRVGRW